MSDDFEKKLREHLHSEAQETREFPRRLRGRIMKKAVERTIHSHCLASASVAFRLRYASLFLIVRSLF